MCAANANIHLCLVLYCLRLLNSTSHQYFSLVYRSNAVDFKTFVPFSNFSGLLDACFSHSFTKVIIEYTYDSLTEHC